MYGMVNRAVGDLVTSRFGEPTWQRVKARAGVEVEVFVSMDTYDDASTYRLVDAAAVELNLPAETILEVFGEHWVEYASQHGYRDMMSIKGQSMFDFLSRLDDLHARLALSFPKLKPPSFQTVSQSDGSMRVHYFSSREGLAPMVTGLLRGLGKLFEVEVLVLHDRRKGPDVDHDEFVVRYPVDPEG